MFGERYFAARERLSGVMRGIASLAKETDAQIDGQLPLDELEKGLGNPFLFVVCGEVNAGKSTLINGLFGTDLCKVSVLPETSRVIYYSHAEKPRDVEVAPLQEERYRPLEFLRDFHLIDTPGTNSSIKGHHQIIEQVFPVADLVLFVFPVTNPWASATWDFISKFPDRSNRRIAIIIQQSDQREAEDISVILGHLRDLSMKRIGYVPPIFAISGKTAVEAKRAKPPSKEKLKQSGYPDLEDFISRSICESAPRRALLEKWRGQAATALRTVEDSIEDQTRTLRMQDRFLDEIEGEIVGMRERFINRLDSHLSGVAEVFQTEAVGVSVTLGKRLRAIPSIFRLFFGDRSGQEMESLFIARLEAAIESVAAIDGNEVVQACRKHWTDLGPRVEKTIGVDIGNTVALDERLTTARERFVERLGRVAREGIANLKVRNQLDKVLRRRNLALKSFTFMTLLLIAAGATCGALALPWIPFILCGLALIFLIGGMLSAWVTKRRIVADFEERLQDTCGSFASTLQSDYEEALRVFFQDYGDSLTAVRKHIVAEKQAVLPRSQRWQELFLTLKAIEQDL